MTLIGRPPCPSCGKVGLACHCNAGLKQREGDQPLPTAGEGLTCHEMAVASLKRHRSGPAVDQVAADMMKRLELGVSRYGTGLRPFNGRNMTQDCYEEVLDALAYGRGELVEMRKRGDRHLGWWETVHLKNLENIAVFLREQLNTKESS